MKVARPILPFRWMLILCIVAGVYGIAVLAYIFIETGTPKGARDFHQFWYAGHFILQGRDPYAAYFAGEQPGLPIVYLDHVIVNQYPVAQPNLAATPSNTPIMLLLLTPLSCFSWRLAKWLFLIINLVLVLMAGRLVLRHIPFAGIRLAPIDELAAFLIFFVFSSTRIAIENGQTTLLVFLLMILALKFANQFWPAAGISLGIALSKYSLSLPVFLFFLFKKKYKILLLAITVQIFGIVTLAAVTRTSPVTIVFENIRLFLKLFDQSGVHLARQLEFFTENKLLAEIPVAGMTVFVFVLLFRWLHKRRLTISAMEEIKDFHLVTILFIWTILVAYHRLYDTLILIYFLVLIFKGLAYPNIWKLNHKKLVALWVYISGIPPILILPARIIDKFFPAYYPFMSNAVTSIFFVGMLFITMFLLREYIKNLPAENNIDTRKPHHIKKMLIEAGGQGGPITSDSSRSIN